MSRIWFAAYSEMSAHKVRKIFDALSLDVHVQVWNAKEAPRILERGVRVIMARGGTASRIRNILAVPVVEVPIPFEDMVAALLKACEYGRNIGVVGYYNLLKGLELLNPMLNVNIRQIFADDEPDTFQKIQELARSGVDVIVGGVAQANFAKKMGIHNVIIEFSEKALSYAYNEANTILESVSASARKAEELNTILNTTKEGYIAINADGLITLANKKAYQLSPGLAERLEGLPIDRLFPEFSCVRTVLEERREILQEIASIKNKEILFDVIPLGRGKDKSENFGAIVTFNDVNTITVGEQKIRERVRQGFYAHYSFDSILGGSEAIKECIRVAKKYAATDSSVLILGETGVGKEIFAQSIHNRSARKENPFVAVNCATLPESILESELFGYEAGAFTDAKKSGKAGLFELAHKGTIFLDEISEMPLVLQSRLLRVLQERKVMRLGGDRVIPVDVKVIAATNNNLMEMVKKNKFRSDLFYRLNVLTIAIPPLRERGEDVVTLAQTFQKHFNPTGGRQLSESALRQMLEYGWPGNVRQLRHFMEKLNIISDTPIITGAITRNVIENYEPAYGFAKKDVPARERKKASSSKDDIEKALTLAEGNKTQAASILGIHRGTLWRLMKEHHLAGK